MEGIQRPFMPSPGSPVAKSPPVTHDAKRAAVASHRGEGSVAQPARRVGRKSHSPQATPQRAIGGRSRSSPPHGQEHK
eukprot:5478421-Karenia_brevis.AAC.1